MNKIKIIFFNLVTLIILISCASTTNQGTTGIHRTQVMLVSSEEINEAAINTYEQTKRQAQSNKTLDTNKGEFHRVHEVAHRLIPQTAIFRPEAPQWKWEVHVISSGELNAYCMPGGKIIFYSGLIEKLKLTDGEIAK